MIMGMTGISPSSVFALAGISNNSLVVDTSASGARKYHAAEAAVEAGAAFIILASVTTFVRLAPMIFDGSWKRSSSFDGRVDGL